MKKTVIMLAIIGFVGGVFDGFTDWNKVLCLLAGVGVFLAYLLVMSLIKNAVIIRKTKEAKAADCLDLNDKYDYLISHNYYGYLSQDEIGKCEATGFKQEYDNALFDIALRITSERTFALEIMNNLYSKIYYPISKTPLKQFKDHVITAVANVAKQDSFLDQYMKRHPDIIGLIFNLWLSQMVVHEEATDSINRLYKERVCFEN